MGEGEVLRFPDILSQVVEAVGLVGGGQFPVALAQADTVILADDNDIVRWTGIAAVEIGEQVDPIE